MKDVFRVFNLYLKSPQIAIEYKLYRYLWMSMLSTLTIIFFLFILYFIGVKFIISSFIPSLLGLVTDGIGFIMFGVIILIGFKYIVLIGSAPVMGPLSERVEEKIKGVSDGESLSFARMLKEFTRGIRINLRNLFWELIFTIGLLLLSFIPVFTVFTTPLIFLIGAYYIGFGSIDYYLERHLGVKDSIRFVKGNRGVVTALGSIFLVILLIPFIGVIIAPFYATIVATIIGVEILEDDHFEDII